MRIFLIAEISAPDNVANVKEAKERAVEIFKEKLLDAFASGGYDEMIKFVDQMGVTQHPPRW